MTNNVGFSVGEGVANGATAFTEPSKRNIGLAFERERGPENKLFRYTSQAEDRAIFGGLNANMYGPTVSRNLIKNAKGFPTTIYGLRIIGTGTVAATTGVVALNSVNHTYSAAYLGTADKGSWGNDIDVIFYSFDHKVSQRYAVEVYYKGAFVEGFDAVTMAALQVEINEKSKYVAATLSAEYPAVVWTTGAGTYTTTAGSTTVTGVGTSFSSTTTPVGTILRDSTTDSIIGTVASITSTTVIVLEKPAQYIGTGAAYEIYLRFSSTFSLANGAYVAPSESDFVAIPHATNPKGLAIFDGADVQIIAMTENNTLTMAQELNSYCAGRKDVLGLITLPQNASDTVKSQFATALQTNNVSFVAAYNCWVQTSDEANGKVIVPGIGCIIGAAYIRVPALSGDGIHIPPGGIDSAFTDVYNVYPETLTDSQLNLDTRTYTVNNVRFTNRIGWWVVTSRTMSTNVLYQSVHIRLQTSFYVRVLILNMGFVQQLPNTPELKKRIYTALYNFFKPEWDIGALERSVSFETACQIICDMSNNPATQPRTYLNADVNWIPTEVTEAFKISLNRNDGVLTVTANS
jgi:hypothetical protein